MLPLSEALVEKKEWEHASMLEFGFDAMARILRKLVAIQDGVVHDDRLRETRGLTHELLEAFGVIVAFVCAMSSAMHNIAWGHRGRDATDPERYRGSCRSSSGEATRDAD